jgi:phosphotriesterase-related protein
MNKIFFLAGLVVVLSFCTSPLPDNPLLIQDVEGLHEVDTNLEWLSHEHILVDFIGADSIDPADWDHDSVMKVMVPFLQEVKANQVNFFVDATPNFLGRDARLLKKLARETGLRILTNTGLYGAVGNKYIPAYAYEKSAEELAQMWIAEFREGIEGTEVKPGFIKISVDAADPLDPLHAKLVQAAALTHLETGLTIGSHTGPAVGLWPQLEILQKMGVSPEAFIWIHAQNEKDPAQYLKAAEAGCWISLDGLGWEVDEHVDKILFAKEQGILDHILISHDAGWYDPQKESQDIKPYTNIFEELYPRLKAERFTEIEWRQLMSVNPARAFALQIRKL